MANIGKVIAYQINQTDPEAFSRWQAKDLTMIGEDEGRSGGILMKIRAPIFKGLGYLQIDLKDNDKYRVRVYKMRNLTKKMKAKILSGDFEPKDLENTIGAWDDITKENLVSDIDQLLGV